MNVKPSIAVIILTYNESIHLSRALDHIRIFAREVFVVDSFSTDNTVELAKAGGAQVLQHPFKHQAQQFQWALENAPITSDWVMRLDADEIIESDLAQEITAKLDTLPPDINGVNLNRKTIFQGKFIRFGGRYPLTLLRIWRRGKAKIEDRWMDEHIYLTEGRTVTFHGGFADHNLFDLTAFTTKHNSYASREALDVLNRRLHLFEPRVELTRESTAKQAKIKRFFKEYVYNRLPFEISTIVYFLFRYVFQMGFLDGRKGFSYHVLQGFWYRFLVGAKLRELEEAVKDAASEGEVRSEIARLTRQSLT
ncbi:glycosyltransferase family 2 protein [Telmatobacter sp. DSM 110680]|uniref:Glycosyltransferase family 2 protein n=1 Tax=Telmatobacter sp. DSM 110680 TaxID=3036704 RepID=A0AAU7DF03_9BACT